MPVAMLSASIAANKAANEQRQGGDTARLLLHGVSAQSVSNEPSNPLIGVQKRHIQHYFLPRTHPLADMAGVA